MTTLDLTVLCILGLTTALGLWKGIIGQIATLGGIIIGYILASKFYQQVATTLPEMEPGLAKAVGFLIVFVGAVVAAAALGAIFSRLLKSAGMGWSNRIGGGILGFAKGFLVVAVITLVLVVFLPNESQTLTEAITLPYILSGIKVVNALIPQEMRDRYNTKSKEIELRLDEKLYMKKIPAKSQGK